MGAKTYLGHPPKAIAAALQTGVTTAAAVQEAEVAEQLSTDVWLLKQGWATEGAAAAEPNANAA